MMDILGILLIAALFIMICIFYKFKVERSIKHVYRIIDFLYTHNDARIVPFRISIQVGHFHYSLNRRQAREILSVLLYSKSPIKDLHAVKKDVVHNSTEKDSLK